MKDAVVAAGIRERTTTDAQRMKEQMQREDAERRRSLEVSKVKDTVAAGAGASAVTSITATDSGNERPISTGAESEEVIDL